MHACMKLKSLLLSVLLEPNVILLSHAHSALDWQNIGIFENFKIYS